MPYIANQSILVPGCIIVIGVVGAAAVAISQVPEIQALAQDCRRKIAVALHNLGDEINPNRPQQPRFNRPEDAEGFMQAHAAGGEMDADEESRRRQREELMYWNAIKLENLEKQKAKENTTKGPTFDDILRNNSAAEEETAAMKTGAEVQEDAGLLRRRGEGSRGMDRGSAYANPFADENYLDSDGDAKMIAPEEDEVDDIYTDNDLRNFKKPAPENRVLAAASDYPAGYHYTAQLENPSVGMMQAPEGQIEGSHFNTITQDYLLGLEQENLERGIQYGLPRATYRDLPELPREAPSHPGPLMQAPASTFQTPAEPIVERPTPALSFGLDQVRPDWADGETQLLFSQEPRNQNLGNYSRYEPVTPSSEHKRMRDQRGDATLKDYQMQLILLEQQNKRRKFLASHEHSTCAGPEAGNSNKANGSDMVEDYEMQSMYLDNQKKRRERMEQSQSSREAAAGSNEQPVGNHALQDYQMQLMLLEQQNKLRLTLARQEQDRLNQPTEEAAEQDYKMQLSLLEQQNEKRREQMRQEQQELLELQEQERQEQANQMQLMLPDHQNKKRLMQEQQETSQQSSPNTSSHPSTSENEETEQLVDVSEPSNSPHPSSTPSVTSFSSNNNAYHTPISEARPNNDNAFASIHAWADSSNSNPSFYSPLPGTPKALSSVASEPEHLSQLGDITPTDSISLAGSGEDVGNDNASSVGGGRYDDVMSVDGEGVSTPGSWTEVGSVVSEDDASHR